MYSNKLNFFILTFINCNKANNRNFLVNIDVSYLNNKEYKTLFNY